MFESHTAEFKRCCVTSKFKYRQINEHITLIDNFFYNFHVARNFITSRDRWDTNVDDGGVKSGVESRFPFWFISEFLDQYFLDRRLTTDGAAYTCYCNYQYKDMPPKVDILSSTSVPFPHIDGIVSEDGCLRYICLVNLNKDPVSTLFYRYKNNVSCSNQTEFDEFQEYVEEKSKVYFNLKENGEYVRDDWYETVEEVELHEEITFKPNQAIIYPANHFHSGKIDSRYTKENPRVMLAMSFDVLLDDENISNSN